MIRKYYYIGFEELIAESITLMNQLTALKKGELKRIQGQSGSTKVSMVYLNMVQEAQNVVSFTANLLKVCWLFLLVLSVSIILGGWETGHAPSLLVYRVSIFFSLTKSLSSIRRDGTVHILIKSPVWQV